MKKIIYLFLVIILLGTISCQKDDPVVADITELATVTLSEDFMAQPITFNDELIAIINKDEETHLASYDAEGNKNWIQNIESYSFSGVSFEELPFLDLKKDPQNELLINMYLPTDDTRYQFVRAIKFNQDGQYLWQLTDSIHQPDTIIMGTDTIDMVTKPFQAGDFFNFTDGGYGVISYVDSVSIDSTFVQLTQYNNDGQFRGNRYYKIESQFEIANAYLTSNNTIFILTGTPLGNREIMMLDIQGNVLFKEAPPFNILTAYMFYENSRGEYIISASAFINSDVARGIVVSFNQSGNEIWRLESTLQPNSGFVHSVNERSDGYIFSGLSSNSAIFDWRNDAVNSDYRAMILRADLNGNQQGEPIVFNSPWFFSAGAGTIGDDAFTFFMRKKDGPTKNIALIKFDEQGQIRN